MWSTADFIYTKMCSRHWVHCLTWFSFCNIEKVMMTLIFHKGAYLEIQMSLLTINYLNYNNKIIWNCSNKVMKHSLWQPQMQLYCLPQTPKLLRLSTKHNFEPITYVCSSTDFFHAILFHFIFMQIYFTFGRPA